MTMPVDGAVITKSLGLLIMRLGIGALFIKHGCDKALGGVPMLTWVGNQMLLIQAFPLFWGVMAMLAELLGGLLLMLGWYTRCVAFVLAFVMVVAVVYHITHQDDFAKVSHPLSLLFVFLALMVSGPGIYAFDGDYYDTISEKLAAWWTYLVYR